MIMRAAMFALLTSAACGGGRQGRQDRVVEIGALGRVSPTAERDLMAALTAQRPMLSICSDPWRPRVAPGGANSIPVVVHVVGARGGVVMIMLDEQTQLGPAFDACVADALRTVSTQATGDYDLVVRTRLCIRAERP